MSPVQVGVRLILILAVLVIAYLVRDLLILGFVGLLLAILLSYPVGLLARWMPRGLATLIVLVSIAALTAQFWALMAPRISEQFQSAMSSFPAAVEQVRDWFHRIQRSASVSQFSQGGKVVEKFGDRATGVIDSALKAAVPAAKGLTEVLAMLLFVIVTAAYLVYQPESYRRGLRSFVPKKDEAVFDETYERLGVGMRHWLGGIFVAMILMGVVCATGLAIVGVNDWLLLGTLTFIGTFIPYWGAIASAIPGLLIALSQSPRHLLYASFVYLGVHLIEGYIVQPFIMRRAVEVKPVVLLMGQAMMMALFGVLGAVIAAPFLVCVQIALEYLYVERTLEKGESQKPSPRRGQAAA